MSADPWLELKRSCPGLSRRYVSLPTLIDPTTSFEQLQMATLAPAEQPHWAVPEGWNLVKGAFIGDRSGD